MNKNCHNLITKDFSIFLFYIKKILNEYEKNIIIFQMLLNIVLVKFNIRKTTLIELNNFDKDEKEKYIKLLNDFVKKLSLIKTYDYTKYRYFVSRDQINTPKNDIEIGKLLEFSCYNHDFGDVNTERISYEILEEKTQSNIYTEVCVKNKIDDESSLKNNFIKKVKMWNKKINKLNLPYKFILRINVIEPNDEFLLPEYYKNKKFVLNNIQKYQDILYNDFFSNSKFSIDEKLIINKFSGFKFIMDNLKYFDMLYNKKENRYPSKGFDILLKNLENLENNIINLF